MNLGKKEFKGSYVPWRFELFLARSFCFMQLGNSKQIGFNMCLTGVKLAGFAFKVWKMECSTVDSGYLGPKTGC